MLKAGKKTRAWAEERARLKVKFKKWGITTCEAKFPHPCWHDNGLSFAHKKKRRNLLPSELGEVALLCINAHDQVELLPEEKMCKIIEGIIAARTVRTS